MDLNDHLRALEESLLLPFTRKNETRLEALLAAGFREFGSSGTAFTKADILTSLQAEAPTRLSLDSFSAELLAPGVALVTYRATRQRNDVPATHSLRSSVWVLRDGRWQILFHQGTTVPAIGQV